VSLRDGAFCRAVLAHEFYSRGQFYRVPEYFVAKPKSSLVLIGFQLRKKGLLVWSRPRLIAVLGQNRGHQLNSDLVEPERIQGALTRAGGRK